MAPPRKKSGFEFTDVNGQPLQRQFQGSPAAWKQDALAVIAGIKPGWVGIGEDMRVKIAAQVGHPHDNNAYGPLIKRATQLRLIEKTGRYRAMRGELANGRSSELYRKLP